MKWSLLVFLFLGLILGTMSTEIDLHPVQSEILRALLFLPMAKFSQLNLSGLTNDHFTFHIKKLLENGLVEKVGMKYTLSTKGKEFANRMDTDTAKIERQAKLAVLVVGIKEEGEIKYLVQQRLKQPYFGFHGFVSGKIRWGEKLEEAAKREFREETGLEGKAKLMGVEHKQDVKDGVILEDKYFYIFRMTETVGELNINFEGGKNTWFSENDIRTSDKVFDDMFDILDLINGASVDIIERQFEVSEY